jgi:hypothetical protein
MQPVLLDGIVAQRLKGSKANMQRNFSGFDTTLRETIEDLAREMQTGGRGGDGAEFARENRLILIAVFRGIGTVDTEAKGYGRCD